MTLRFASPPAFGKADLSNCEREQIHVAGSIQPHGALLMAREPDLTIVQASANAQDFLGLDGEPLGQKLDVLDTDLLIRAKANLADALDTIPLAVRCRIGESSRPFDALLHRPPSGGLIIELERAGPPVDFSADVQKALEEVIDAPSLQELCDSSARIVRDLTGYDRVMLYRFDQDGHGQVFAEERNPDLETYLGNWYPASDIPQIARRLYERNRVRMLADVGYEPVPVVSADPALPGDQLDMSLCFLRSMSPIHIQYLKNMGVGATLVASIVVGGRLWGLIACHHYAPRLVHYEMRAVCELLSETIATRIAALESFARTQSELSVRRLEGRMTEAIAREGDWKSGLFSNSGALLKPLNATGAALIYEGYTYSAGDVPGTHKLRQIAKWLDARRDQLISTAALGVEEPEFASLAPVASGLVAVPVSSDPGEYLIWFRPERVHTVTWGGNPFKPFHIGDRPEDLSPRRSFAKWHQQVEGTCDPWTAADLAVARMVGESVSDVVIQFRSLRILIIQDQLKQLKRQIRPSKEFVIIADSKGTILLKSEAFERLMHGAELYTESIKGLPQLFSDPDSARDRLTELLRQRRSWRGEIEFAGELDGRTFMVRADPVYSLPGQVLGFVLLFIDVTERKSADMARRRLQEGLARSDEIRALRLETSGDMAYLEFLSTLVSNAQRAVLEIADGVDLERVPDMLDGVRSSMTRTAELIEHLMVHAKDKPGQD